MKKPLLSVLISLVSVSVLAGTAVADPLANPVAPENQQTVWLTQGSPHSWTISNPNPNSENKVWVGMSFNGGAEYSGFSSQILGRISNNVLCDKTFMCFDREPFSLVTAQGEFPDCSEFHQAPCVKSLEFQVGTGDFRTAERVYTVNPAPTVSQIDKFKRDSRINPIYVQDFMGWRASEIPGLPPAATGPSVYRFPGVDNAAGSDTYLLSANYFFEGTFNKLKVVGGRFTDFQTAIRPVFVDNSKSGSVINFEETLPNGKNQMSTSYEFDSNFDGNGIAYLDRSSVGYAASFPKDLTIRLQMKLPRDIGGWLQGRADSPSVTFAADAAGDNDVVITAKPTTVPVAQTDFYPLDPKFASFMELIGAKRTGYYDELAAAQASGQYGLRGGWAWNSSLGTEAFVDLTSALGQTAGGYISEWRFNRFKDGIANGCMSDSSALQGVLTTNAMTYQPELPTYSDGQLTYKVAGLHLDAFGNVFQGTYSFIMRDSVARCLYGFRDAPISGTVSVTSSDGAEQVAYTNVTDRDGWLKLTAQGFTFSNPTISAKLTQAPEVKPTPTPTPTQTAKPSSSPTPTTSPGSKLKAILCVKGSVVRKVSGANPKCPAGYKKKA